MSKICDIDYAVHDIEQMVEVALRSSGSLLGAGHDKQKFELPAEDAQLLDFSLNDIAKRVKALRENIEVPEHAATVVGGNGVMETIERATFPEGHEVAEEIFDLVSLLGVLLAGPDAENAIDGMYRLTLIIRERADVLRKELACA